MCVEHVCPSHRRTLEAMRTLNGGASSDVDMASGKVEKLLNMVDYIAERVQSRRTEEETAKAKSDADCKQQIDGLLARMSQQAVGDAPETLYMLC